jgi:hypothetical protein
MSEPSKRCANCGTVRYAIHAKGYCRDCYDPHRRKVQVEQWDATKLKTLKTLPKGGWGPDGSPDLFRGHSRKALKDRVPEIQQRVLKEIDKRLRSLWSREVRLSGPIEGMDIELMLRQLAQKAGARDRNILHGIATLVTAYFKPKQRRMLFGWLNEIEENTPWGPRRRWRRQKPARKLSKKSQRQQIRAERLLDQILKPKPPKEKHEGRIS